MDRFDTEELTESSHGAAVQAASEASDDASPPPPQDGWWGKVDPEDGVPIQAKLRQEYAGKWVAWSANGESIVASAEDLGDMDRQVQEAGITGAIYEWVELPGLRFGGCR